MDVTARPIAPSFVRSFVKLTEAPAHVRKAAAAYLELARVRGVLVGSGRKVRR